jgi:hypothetical protein
VSTPTPHSPRASVYREAARLIAQDKCGFSCWAIAIAGGFEAEWDRKGYKPPVLTEYVETFTNGGNHVDLQLRFDDEGDAMATNLRVLALCFMAAITERP